MTSRDVLIISMLLAATFMLCDTVMRVLPGKQVWEVCDEFSKSAGLSD